MGLRLVVSATRLEAEPLASRLGTPSPAPLDWGEGVCGRLHGVPLAVAWLGVGKANTAAGIALAVRALRPSSVIQVGIGGAFDGWGLESGTAAVASEEVHLDLGAASPAGFEDLEELGFPLLTRPTIVHNRVPVDRELSLALAAESWPLLPFGTGETVTGSAAAGRELGERYRVALESMEGAAAAQVCHGLEVPFGEVRGVSNRVGDRERGGWLIKGAVRAAHEVLERWFLAGAPASR